MSDDADRLRQLAEQTRDAALLRIRRAFHDRWGIYLKCGRCGGRLALARAISEVQCPHGVHDCEPMKNGYSWTRSGIV